MGHKIERGQIYESCQPVDGLPGGQRTRIKIVGEPVNTPGLYGFGKVMVATLNEDGRELRHRAIEVKQLHATGTTGTGQQRRTGYRLVSEG